MKYSWKLVIISALVLCGIPCLTLADPDRYMGDTAIYGVTNIQKANVVILIDNGGATLNFAAGEAYDPETVYQNQGYSTYTIYEMDNQGNYSKLAVANNTAALENLSCWTPVVKNTLLASGTYSGVGSYDYPVIKNNKKQCETGNNVGATYALGNFLNYAKTPPSGGETKSQRRMIFEALAQALDGAKGAVNVAAVSYGRNNKGGKLLHGMTSLSNPADMDAFLQVLPGAGRLVSGSWVEYPTAEAVLDSATLRPMSDALYDAGRYLGATYTEVTLTTQLELSKRNPCDDSTQIIFITNGLPNGDGSNPVPTTVGDYDGDGMENLPYAQGTHYLDDVAKKLNTEYGFKTNMVLAFQAADPLVERTAGHGEGKYFNVFNQQELTAALANILAGTVASRNTTFVAPVVSASPENRTTTGERLYLGFFMPKSHKGWYGNLKKFGFNPTTNQLLGFDSTGTLVPATNADGEFLSEITSFWYTAAGDHDSNQVNAGGVGEILLDRAKTSYVGIGSSEAFFSKTDHRAIFTYLSGATGATTNLAASVNRVDIDNTHLLGEISSSAAESVQVVKYLHGLDAFDHDYPRYEAVCDPYSAQYHSTDPKCGFGASPHCVSTSDTDCTQHVRDWILGDIIHSKPLVIHYKNYDFSSANESDPNQNKTYIFTGANDGMLHVFEDRTGQEAWAFVPPGLLSHLPFLQEVEHSYFVDGTPVAYIHDQNYDGTIDSAAGDKVILIFGTRRGGGLNTLPASGSRGSYYALDVTSPTNPVFLWEINNETGTSFSELGESWSTPRLAKIQVDAGGGVKSKIVAFIGAGYDNNEDLRWGNTQLFPDTTDASTILPLQTDVFTVGKSSGTSASGYNSKGRGVYAIEVATLELNADNKYTPSFTNSGTKIWGYTFANNSAMKYSIPSDITVMDRNFDGFVDRLYVGDTGGQLWRFEVGNANPANWTAKLLFVANPSQANSGESPVTSGRKIFYRPAVSRLDANHTMVFFGTGDREHPTNYLNPGASNGAVIDRIYAVRDDQNDPVAGALTEADLENVTSNELQQDLSGTLTAADLEELRSRLEQRWDPVDGKPFRYGWYIRLDTHHGEKVLAQPLFFDNSVFFTTYTPYPITSDELDVCSPGNSGVARVWALNYLTGEAVFDFYTEKVSSDIHGEQQGVTNNDRAGGGEKNADGSYEYILRRADRFKNIGSGIPPGITPEGLVPAEDRVVPVNMGSSGSIHPLYWLQR